MRRMILRMIATGSLSAFSSSVLQGLSCAPGMTGPRSPDSATAITPVRLQTAPDASTATSRPTASGLSFDSGTARLGGTSPDRPLPRGSLLDLSV
jgi:hypothetical protein